MASPHYGLGGFVPDCGPRHIGNAAKTGVMMNKVRCKPGDLAVVIDARNKCNLGAVVQVIELHHGSGDLRYPTKQNAWLVKSSKVLNWNVDGKRYRRKCGPVPDTQLQPIRGYPLGRDIAEGLKEIKGVLTAPKKSTRKDKTC